jgi:hypothetical protein
VIGPRTWSRLGDGLDRFDSPTTIPSALRSARVPRCCLIKVCYTLSVDANRISIVYLKSVLFGWIKWLTCEPHSAGIVSYTTRVYSSPKPQTSCDYHLLWPMKRGSQSRRPRRASAQRTGARTRSQPQPCRRSCPMKMSMYYRRHLN